ncbi:hypothetical protein RSAG8_10539, partial [Rhizoctonia solani AG-8 WAC10335]
MDMGFLIFSRSGLSVFHPQCHFRPGTRASSNTKQDLDPRGLTSLLGIRFPVYACDDIHS